MPRDKRSRAVTAGIIALAIGNWFALFGRHGVSLKEIVAICAGVLAAIVPGASEHVCRFADAVGKLLSRNRALVAAFFSIAVAGLLLFQAHATGNNLFPRLHDEHVYLIQARMLEIGRLWLPPHPPSVRPFFDEFYLINDPVYAPMYFPGTALLMLPALWLGLPYWITPFLAASIAAGLVYLIAEELVNPILAALAVLVSVCVPAFRNVALLMLSQMPFTAMALLMLWAWMRFRRAPRVAWCAAIGGALGLAVITRPLDASCFAIPILLAIGMQLHREPKKLAARVALVALAASPFLVLQLVQNTGITGRWWEFPESYYNARNFPAPVFGFHQVDPSRIPHFASPAKNQAMRDLAMPAFAEHEFPGAITGWYSGRFKTTLMDALPDPLLVLLLPLRFLVFRDARRWAMAAALGLYILGYALFVFYLAHYVVPVVPMLACLVVVGLEAASARWPSRGGVRAGLLVMVSVVCVGTLPPFGKLTAGAQGAAPNQLIANVALEKLPPGRAVVLFQYDAKHMNWPDDPVYNDGAAWPDEARVVRVWDLGEEEDQKLFRYYSEREPDRVFYFYDMSDASRGKNPFRKAGFGSRDAIKQRAKTS
jgi:hypothetical protein